MVVDNDYSMWYFTTHCICWCNRYNIYLLQFMNGYSIDKTLQNKIELKQNKKRILKRKQIRMYNNLKKILMYKKIQIAQMLRDITIN